MTHDAAGYTLGLLRLVAAVILAVVTVGMLLADWESMARKTKKDPQAWRSTAKGTDKYRAARTEAQARANATGCDVGLEANDLFQYWNTFLLPARQYRNGHELRCEVVMPDTIVGNQPGHGACK